MAQLPITERDLTNNIGELIKEASEDEQNFILGTIYGTLYRKTKEGQGNKDA